MIIDLRFVARDLRRLDETSAEVIACGIYRDARPMTGLAGLCDWRLAGRLSRLAKQGFLLGEVGEVLAVPVRPRLPFDKLLVAGLGPRASFGDATFKKVLDRMVTSISGLHCKKAILELPGRGDDAITAERAADMLLDVIGDDERDVLTFVENTAGRERIEKRAHERRREQMRSEAVR